MVERYLVTFLLLVNKMVIAIFPILLFFVGLVIYALSKNNDDLKDIGRIMLWIGLFWTTYVFSKLTITLP